MRIQAKKQEGFTLVEIAIVLVIIGLLLGAVFKGQELINQAKIKNIAKKYNEVRAASYTFLDKYNQMPGDAKELTGIQDATDPQDGQIDNTSFWAQIHASGLLDGSGETPLKTPFGTNFYAGFKNAGFDDNTICAVVPKDIAAAFDTKYDDGNGATGNFRGAGDGANNAPNTTSSDYTTDTVWMCTKL